MWRSFRKGNRAALAQIFNDHYDSLYVYGKKLISDDDLVKDCLQNLFLKIWVSRDRLAAIEVVRPYLMKSLRRHIADQVTLRTRTRLIHENFNGEFDVTFSHEDFLIAVQTSLERSTSLVRALNRLPPRHKEAIFLRFYESLSYEKIADVMSLNVQSVRNLIYQSLKTIKVQLAPSATVVLKGEVTRR